VTNSLDFGVKLPLFLLFFFFKKTWSLQQALEIPFSELGNMVFIAEGGFGKVCIALNFLYLVSLLFNTDTFMF